MESSLEWFAAAACVGRTELFFAPAHSETTKQRRDREYSAIAICKLCPSMIQCRNYARTRGELGLWGGETEDQRWRAGYINASIRRRSVGYYQAQKNSPIIEVRSAPVA